jgi:hypothetical protein
MILFDNNAFYVTFGDLKLPRIDSDTYPFGLIQLATGELGIAESIMKPLLDTIQPSFKTDMSSTFVPKDTGLTSFEKTAIQTSFQQLQPISDFMTVFSDTLAICEDIAARYTGTSVEVLGKQIGIPSRKPSKYDSSKKYTETVNSKIQQIKNANNLVQKIANKIDVKALKSDVSAIATDLSELPERIYVAYYDNNGNSVTPPKWVDDRWFKVPGTDISAPFKNLSKIVNTGTQQIRDTYNSVIDINKNSLEKALKNAVTDDEKLLVNKLYSDISDTLIKTLDGDNNPSNIPGVLSEYIIKQKSSQLRQKYYPPFISTAQEIDNKIVLPTIQVKYKNVTYNVEQPLSFKNQITTDVANNRNKIISNTLDSYSTDRITHFNNDIKDVFIPDNIKDYFLPIVWQEITEYELILDNKVIGTEKDISSKKIDIEQDYVIRVIKVINKASATNIIPDKIPFNNKNLEGVVNYKDARYPDTTKYPHFFLIEAIRKDSNDISEYINSTNQTSKKSDDWYGLTDRLSVNYLLISKLVPIISTQMLPIIAKTIANINNPKKLLQTFTVDGETPLTKNFKPLSSKFLNKMKKVKTKEVRTNTDEYYDGPQKNVKNPEPILMYDGSASLDGIGLDISLKKGEVGSEKLEQKQPFIQFLLQIIQIPIKILKAVFEFISEFVKKLLNPITMIPAIEDFLTFEWLKKIMRPSNVSLMAGYGDISVLKKSLNNIVSQNFSLTDVYNIRKLKSGQEIDYFEVYLYNLVKQNMIIGTETETIPVYKNANSNPDPRYTKQLDLDSLGLPLNLPEYPSYMLPIIKDNMLSQINGQLNILEKMINSIINIPSSIFGINLETAKL